MNDPEMNSVVMSITVVLRGADDESVDLESLLFIHPMCDPETYSPAFKKITDQYSAQFDKAIRVIKARRN